MPKKVVFTVRKIYYVDIVSGKKTEEIRNPTHWQWLLGDDPPEVAVFLCGPQNVHRRWIKRIYLEEAEKVLGREPSEQGKKDLCWEPGKKCIVVEFGDIYIPTPSEA